MVLSCQRKEAKSQRTIPFDQRIVPYLKAAGFLGDSLIGLAPHCCFSIALETGDPYISYALWEMHHHVAGHYDSVGLSVNEESVVESLMYNWKQVREDFLIVLPLNMEGQRLSLQ